MRYPGPTHDARMRAWQDHWDQRVSDRRLHSAARARMRLLGPVVVSLIVQVPSVFFTWSQANRGLVSETHSTGGILLDLVIALIGPIALLGARRFPGPVVVVVAIAASADLLLAGGVDGPPYIALAFAIGSAIVRGARIWAWSAIAGSWLATLVLSGVIGVTWAPWRVVGISFGILVVVGIGEAVRTSRDRAAAFGRTIAERRQTEVQAERVRIARELHDVLAHSLSQINVQAGVGLHLIEKQPEKAAEALASIKETSKSALDEVRSVLGILRAEDGADPTAPLVPEPDLARLPGLAASVTSQGITVTIDDRLGDVPKPVQLAVYRIVQESLTNVVRHARASAATVTLEEEAGGYRIRVADNGQGHVDSRGPAGRGLLGMRERAELLGGTLEAGPGERGGFVVTATIPRKELP